MATERTFSSGPWKGSLRVSEPFIGTSEIARLMTDGYVPDPVLGSGFYSRPGIVAATNASVTTTNPGQGVYSYTALNGTSYNFIFANGAMYRWSTSLTGAPTNVTPTGITISTGKFIYVTALADSLIVNDGVNKPWIATNLGSTPVTGTVIEYETPANLLSRGSTDTALAYTEFWYTYRAGASLGQQGVASTNTVGVALGALGADGTIPANLWGSFRVELNTDTGAFVFTPAAGNDTGYASETLAIAALPARTTAYWYVGYFTVQADAGAVWIAGTDAFAGGATGNQAQTTNYYAGEGTAWSAFGRPVVYTGALFFILQQVEGTYARTTLSWSEPNQPSVGYQQTDYDNNWTLAQTGTSPLYALAATNDALYYSRARSWGALAGAPGVNFQGTATHDIVSGNIGCVTPGTVQQFLNYVYFADQLGRPWRFAVGGAPEALWTQAREVFEDNAARVTQAITAGNAWAVIEPNLNLYICATVPTTGTVPDIPLIFDARTGAFFGFWTVGGGQPQDVAGTVLDANGQSALVFLEPANVGHATTLVIQRLTRVSESVWTDTADIGPSFGLQGHWGGYSADKMYQATVVTALMEVGNAQAVVPLTGYVYSTQGRTALPSNTPVAIGSNVDGIGRYVWMLDSGVQGRALRVQVTASPAQTNQLKLYQVAVTGVESLAGITDR